MEHYMTCPLCEATCGLEVNIEDDKIISIRGDKNDPLSRGHMCPKGLGLKGIHEDPDRIRVPMIRRGDVWEEVSYEEAFDYIRTRMAAVRDTFGDDAIGIYMGNPNVHNLDAQLYLSTVVRATKSKNRFSASSIDQLPKQLVAAFLYGDPMNVPVPDIDRTMYFLVIGGNPMVSNGSMMTAPNMRDRLRSLKQRRGKLVVIDPVRTRTAMMADEHHFIRPGTDVWLLLGLFYVLYDEELTSLDSLRDFVHGLDSIQTLATRMTPEMAEDKCGIEADVIRRIARELASADGAVVYGRMGSCTQRFGGLVTWLIDVINVVTGNLDREGGVMFPLAAAMSHNAGGKGVENVRMGRFHSRVSQVPEVLGEFPVAVMAEEIDEPGEGQIKAFITIAGNPVLSTPNSGRLEKGLYQLELMVSVDFYLNETSRYAHVFLPVPSPLEREHYDLTFYQLSVRNIAHYSSPVLKLPEGQLHEWEVLLHLAAAIENKPFDPLYPSTVNDQMINKMLETGFNKRGEDKKQAMIQHVIGELRIRNGPAKMLDLMIRTGSYGDQFGLNKSGLTLARIMEAEHGLDLGPLAQRLPEVLRTPSGNIEIAPELFLKEVDRLLGTSVQEEMELVLVGRRILQSNNSWMHNVDFLAKGIEAPLLWMHPLDATRLQLGDGDDVALTSASGVVHTKVQVTTNVMVGVVSLPHGFGHEEKGTRLRVATKLQGVNYNRLTSSKWMDAVSGNAVVNGVPVTITKM